MKTKLIFYLILLFLIFVFLAFSLSQTPKLVNEFHGTFTSTEDRFKIISIDSKEKYNFTYYFNDSKQSQKLEVGTLRPVSESTFELSSNSIPEQLISYGDYKFTIVMDGQHYTFLKTDNLPMEIIQPK